MPLASSTLHVWGFIKRKIGSNQRNLNKKVRSNHEVMRTLNFSGGKAQESRMGSAPVPSSSYSTPDWHTEFAIFSLRCSIKTLELNSEYACSPLLQHRQSGMYQNLLMSVTVSHSNQLLEWNRPAYLCRGWSSHSFCPKTTHLHT